MTAAPVPTFAEHTFTRPSYADRDRRRHRYELRDLLADEVSSLPRVRRCGMPVGPADVAVHLAPDITGRPVGHYSGLETCGSPWSCPVCGSKIRAFRAEEISTGLKHALTLGWTVMLATLTIRHGVGDRLADVLAEPVDGRRPEVVARGTMSLLTGGFRALLSGRAAKDERARLDLAGHIRSVEITYGDHGWHPHLHLLLVARRHVTAAEVERLREAWQTRWDRWLARQGWPATEDRIGVDIQRMHVNAVDRLDVAHAALVAAAYVTKWAAEVSRGDLKDGRARGSRTPLDILADYGSTGDAADLARWHEYETATKGRSAIRWSPGLRAELLGTEDTPTDAEVAAEQADGDVVAVIDASVYRQARRIPGGTAMLLAAAEHSGYRGLLLELHALRLPTGGLRRPPFHDLREAPS